MHGRIFLGCKFSQILFLIIIMLHNFNYPIPYLLTIQSIFMLCVEAIYIGYVIGSWDQVVCPLPHRATFGNENV